MPTVEAQQGLDPSQVILQMLTGKWVAQAVSPGTSVDAWVFPSEKLTTAFD